MTSITIYRAKKRRSPTLEEYKKVAQLFDWARRIDYTLYFYGRDVRDGRTERVLKLLKERGYLVAVQYGHGFVYSVKRRNRRGRHMGLEQVEHGLGHTEGLVRLHIADSGAVFTSGRQYASHGFIPEWEATFPNGKKLLYEFCTADNFKRALKSKVARYQEFLMDHKASVLFVSDVERSEVLKFVMDNDPRGAMAFTDYETFKSVDLGNQLSAPIYFWRDGISRPLRP